MVFIKNAKLIYFMKILRFFTLISFTLILNSCFALKASDANNAKKEFTVENNAIPPQFGQDSNEVLLCIKKNRKSYDKYLKAAAELYKGKYEIVSEAQLNSEKYSDTKKYRYIFDYNGGTQVNYSNGNTATAKRFYVKDRLEDKDYSSGSEFTFFAKVMKVYFENLEAKRVSN